MVSPKKPHGLNDSLIILQARDKNVCSDLTIIKNSFSVCSLDFLLRDTSRLTDWLAV